MASFIAARTAVVTSRRCGRRVQNAAIAKTASMARRAFADNAADILAGSGYVLVGASSV